MSFLIADDPGGEHWQDPDRPTDEEISALIEALLFAKAEIARLQAEIARLQGEQEVTE